MCLRFSATLIMGAALAVSSLTHAKTPEKPIPGPSKPPAPSSSSETGLAQVQAIFSYCESVDPHSASKYLQLQSLVLAGNSSGKNDDKNAAYRSEFSTISAELARIPVSTGVASCRSAITGM